MDTESDNPVLKRRVKRSGHDHFRHGVPQWVDVVSILFGIAVGVIVFVILFP